MEPHVVPAAKTELILSLDVRQASVAINRPEEALKVRFPEIRWCVVEPDGAA